MQNDTQTLISIDNVSYAYDDQPVLEDITLDIQRGEFLGLIGPNAGGKSTLLKLILGLLQPDRGTIRVFGDSPESARGRLGYVPRRLRPRLSDQRRGDSHARPARPVAQLRAIQPR